MCLRGIWLSFGMIVGRKTSPTIKQWHPHVCSGACWWARGTSWSWRWRTIDFASRREHLWSNLLNYNYKKIFGYFLLQDLQGVARVSWHADMPRGAVADLLSRTTILTRGKCRFCCDCDRSKHPNGCKACHRSNGVYLVINRKRWVVYQKCHDVADCPDFRSHEFELPKACFCCWVQHGLGQTLQNRPLKGILYQVIHSNLLIP